MTAGWRKVQSATKAYFWLAWATALWGVASFAILHSHTRVPHAVDVLISLSRGFSLFGGFLAVIYVLIGARRPSLILSGVAAAAVNFWHCWDYIRSLV